MAWLRRAYQVSERRVRGATGFVRSSHRYRSMADPQDELRLRLKELAVARVRYAYRRLHVLLRREDWPINAKRVYRLYNEEGLSIRPKTPRRRRSTRYRAGRPASERPNDCWAMDFMSDGLVDGRAFRILTRVDGQSRESLATVPRPNFRAQQVVEILNGLIQTRESPMPSGVTMARSLPGGSWINGRTGTMSNSTSRDPVHPRIMRISRRSMHGYVPSA